MNAQRMQTGRRRIRVTPRGVRPERPGPAVAAPRADGRSPHGPATDGSRPAGADAPLPVAPRSPLYVPTWWERRFPLLLDALAALDPEPIGRSLGRVIRPLGAAVELACAPLAAILEGGAALARAVLGAVSGGVGALARALPLPGPVRDWLWLRPASLGGTRYYSAQELFHSRRRRLGRGALATAVGVHVGVLTLWPAFGVANATYAPPELVVVKVPNVEVPPPPVPIARPATPVLAAGVVDADVTISPTTFTANPVRELPPPPPVESVVEERSEPTLTPFTVPPELLNGSEVGGILAAQYPPLLKAAGVGGTVMIWVFLDERGSVREARIARESEHEALDAAALLVAERMRFSPALDGDRKIAAWVRFPIVFEAR